jgi:hypothetical protein
MPSSLVQRIRIGSNALVGRFRDGRCAVLSGYRGLGKPGNACQNGTLAATISSIMVARQICRQVLRRRFELTGEPAPRFRGHGITRYGDRLNATALAAFEGRDVAAGQRRRVLRQQHAALPAIRAAGTLDGGNTR